MLSRADKKKCVATKEIFSNRYRLSAAVIAPIMDRMVFAGGAFASIFLGEKPRDLDIYILEYTRDDVRILNDYCNINFGEVQKVSDYEFGRQKTDMVWKAKLGKGLVDCDFIFTSHTSAEDVVSEFDFEHTKVYYQKGMMHLSEETFRSIMDMKLVPTKSHDAIDQDRRKKFVDRGWKDYKTPKPWFSGAMTDEEVVPFNTDIV
tara:strand:+ start:2640 stop:3251 length:612 start_codon:yes stop_codon:yes gene_type:complete